MSSEDEKSQEGAGGGGGGPGWINPTIQSKMEWRDGDVVVSVPGKSGTTWTMNIVYQLREKGNRNFEDIYAEVKWVEVVDRPGATVEEMVEKLNGMPVDRPRAFKTHASPPSPLPFIDSTEGNKKVKYVVVARNPEEALVSMRIFAGKHSKEFVSMWGVPHEAFNFPDFPTFYEGFVKGSGFDRQIFEFVRDWWKLKDEPNVLMLHYTDMVNDHEGSVKKISDFLGYGPYTDEEWQTILELTSFGWMKKHQIKFEATTVWEIPALERGGMVRQGSFGLARKEGMTEDIAKEVAERGREILTDDSAFEWLYKGGEL